LRWEQAGVESFFASLKKELVHLQSFDSRRTAPREIFEYFEGFYNTHRRHSFLGQMSPAKFEERASTP